MWQAHADGGPERHGSRAHRSAGTAGPARRRWHGAGVPRAVAGWSSGRHQGDQGRDHRASGGPREVPPGGRDGPRGALRVHREPDRRVAGGAALLARHRVRGRAHPEPRGARVRPPARRRVPQAVRRAGGGPGQRARVRGDAPGPQAAERHPGRAGSAAHRLRHRQGRGGDGSDAGRHRPGHSRLHGSRGPAAGRGGGCRGRVRAGRHDRLRGDRPGAVRDGDPNTVNFRAVHGEIDIEGVEPDLAALVTSCVAAQPGTGPCSPRSSGVARWTRRWSTTRCTRR